MSNRPLQLLIVKDDNILAQKFFTRKRKVEKLRFEFAGGSIKALIASYVPRENSIVLFVEQALKGGGQAEAKGDLKNKTVRQPGTDLSE